MSGVQQSLVTQKTQQSKQPNLSVHFGNEKWNMVLNMMIGIRTSIINVYKQPVQSDSDTDDEALLQDIADYGSLFFHPVKRSAKRGNPEVAKAGCCHADQDSFSLECFRRSFSSHLT